MAISKADKTPKENSSINNKADLKKLKRKYSIFDDNNRKKLVTTKLSKKGKIYHIVIRVKNEFDMQRFQLKNIINNKIETDEKKKSKPISTPQINKVKKTGTKKVPLTSPKSNKSKNKPNTKKKDKETKNYKKRNS